MIVPFLWMISTSLKTDGNVFVYPPQLFPNPIRWQNYKEAWEALPLGRGYWNSIKITCVVVLGTLLTSAMAAFGFARIKFAGRELLFMLLLSTMMIPFQVTLIPMFLVFNRIGWIDTHWPLIVPPLLTNAFGVFLLRQFMLTFPGELEDAGKLDGLNPWGIFVRIVIPNCVPSLIALGIFTFMGNWNSFLGPLIFLNDKDKFTLPLMIASFQGLYATDWPLLMAAASSSLVVILVLFLFAQRYFIEGITLSGLKG